jgi:hypothetical protein
MNTPGLLRDPNLAKLYARTPGTVAYLDESYRDRPMRDQRPFYAMAATIFETAQLDDVRDQLTEIALGRFWHTTEAFQAGRRYDIEEMARYVAQHTTWNVVAVEATITERGGMAEARQTCLAAIAREVTRGEAPDAVRLLVADNNIDPALNRADQRTLKLLRVAGDVNPNTTLYHGRMGEEPMLWTADLVAWSVRRNLAVDDTRWVQPLREVLTVLDARTGMAVEMKQPQGAAAEPGAQQTTGRSGPSTVASNPSLPARSQSEPEGITIDQLAADAVAMRRVLGFDTDVSQFLKKSNSTQAVAARAARVQQRRPEAGNENER